jgi:hypothetical protein
MWLAHACGPPPALTPQQQKEARERRDTQRVGQKLQRGHGDDFPLIEEGSRMTAVTRTERQDRDRQRSNIILHQRLQVLPRPVDIQGFPC